MKFIAMIPARYAATRFPGKLMKLLGDKPVIAHTFLNTVATGVFDQVIVVTDSDLIYNTIESFGGKAIMSKRSHESGSDRIAEAIEDMDLDVVVNVQGDEPFVDKEPLEKLVALFQDETVQVGSIMQPIYERALIEDPNNVKVVVNEKMDSLLFSRSPIPYLRDENTGYNYFHHKGIYAYRKEALLKFTSWKMTPLEAAEKIECLRYLEHGVPLRMVLTQSSGIGIDTPEDLSRAQKLL